jgi:tRNA pseudouridine38-40 synthase
MASGPAGRRALPRIALGVEYDGAAFNGWQIQKDGRSVQHALETALTRVADHAVRVVCAGRTDTGVHATAQVVHFDTEACRADHNWVLGCNSLLPEDVSVIWACEVDAQFHARFSAVERAYTYLIQVGRARSALYRDRTCRLYVRPDAVRMRDAAQALVGTHDFTSFRAAGCQAKSPVRTILSLDLQERGEWLRIDVRANAFLQHMVRNLAGVLIAVGHGDAPVDWPARLLQVRDRREAAMTAPAGGLYLVDVRYPADFSVPRGAPVRIGPWGDAACVGPPAKLV